ncbi:hypothetical protein tb265_49710 [Gemmatimonadetes bacterium T265]|nr:hypothetical protein tb265_49710 [Gemmatimonadetes bacterium T265]
MASPPSPQDRQTLDAVLARASVDRQFRRQLVDDPRQAIQQAFGITIPNGFTMKFVERDRDVDALVVLPDFQNADGELSDADLESVAGGADDGGKAMWASEFGPAASAW